jgi:hypothetical protein
VIDLNIQFIMSELKLLKTDIQSDLSINTDEINLLIANNTQPHPKFTRALEIIFNRCARYYDSEGHFVDLENDTSEVPIAYRQLLSLVKFRSLLTWLRGLTRRLPHLDECAPLTWFELELFLEFHDSYTEADLSYISSLSPYYRHSYVLEAHSNLDDIYDEDESTHNDPVHFTPCFIRWDSILCCSMNGFCKLFVEWSKRSPLTIWRLLFCFGFNGDLELDPLRTEAEKKLAGKGLCLCCMNPITTEITRKSLICRTCCINRVSVLNDQLFVCC